MWVMTPFWIWRIRGAWTAARELAARVRFLKPISASLSTTVLMIWSPLRKWWWKLMVMPSRRPVRRMASSREGTSLFCRVDRAWNVAVFFWRAP